jgi:spectinomycin phosphotransferase
MSGEGLRFCDVRTPPADLTCERLAQALAEGWQLRATSLEYVPEGGGSHHWTAAGDDGTTHFVTVDDLDDKDWMAGTAAAVFAGLRRALTTAAALRDEAGLEFVVAPVATRDGEFLRRVDARYSVSVFPFLAGQSYPFGRYQDTRLRDRAIDMIARLHDAGPAIRGSAPRHVLSFTGRAGRAGLDAFLADPARPWTAGPFSADAHRLLAARAAEVTRLVAGFGHLAAATATARADLVITHGEPHPANLMSLAGRLVLIDWDTVALAPAERDVSLLATAADDGLDRYRRVAGRRLDPDVVTLYRSRWYLDDLASAVRMFSNGHRDTADTRRWRDGLAAQLDRLPYWLTLLT